MLNELNIPAKSPKGFESQTIFHKLQTCNTLAKLSQIHAQILVNGFTQKNFLLAKLLYLYVTYGHAMRALDVSRKLQNPNTTVWNQIIRAHGRTESPWKSVESFKKMIETESEPDGFTYSYLLSACARSGSLLREGQQVHARVLTNGFFSSVFVQTNLVNLYATSEGVDFARKMFDEMSDRNIVAWNALIKGYALSGDIDEARKIFAVMPERNVVSWTTMVSGFVEIGNWSDALSVFHHMRKMKIELDRAALLAALSACSMAGDLSLGRWIHNQIDRSESVLLKNALVHMYASCGAIDEALKAFETTKNRTTMSWTIIIAGLAKQGHGAQAFGFFRRMLRSGEVKPDDVTLVAALSACSHSGLVDEGREIFKFMSLGLKIEPNIKHYGCVVDLLSRAGFLDEARTVIETMPMKPSHVVWGALLNGCRLHGNAELASGVARRLIVELDCDGFAGYLVLLANVFAGARRWLDFSLVWRAIGRAGERKLPGRSWVQIEGVVYGFVAGDTSHSCADSIREMLVSLTQQDELGASDFGLCDEVH